MGQLLRALLLEHGLAALAFSLEYDLDIMTIRTQRISPSLLISTNLARAVASKDISERIKRFKLRKRVLDGLVGVSIWIPPKKRWTWLLTRLMLLIRGPRCYPYLQRHYSPIRTWSCPLGWCSEGTQATIMSHLGMSQFATPV